MCFVRISVFVVVVRSFNLAGLLFIDSIRRVIIAGKLLCPVKGCFLDSGVPG